MKSRLIASILLLSVALAIAANVPERPAPNRAEAAKLMRDGNFKEALEIFKKLMETPQQQAAQDLQNAFNCQMNLGMVNESEELIERAVASNVNNHDLLMAAANLYLQIQHNGTMVAGKYDRGRWDGGERVSSWERDYVRAMQLMNQALSVVAKQPGAATALPEVALRFSQMLISRSMSEQWRLQSLTDLAALPDYERGERFRDWYGGGMSAAPVDADGNPVYHYIPKSWDEAKTDGERWRWLLSKCTGGYENAAKQQFASFLHSQFGVHSLDRTQDLRARYQLDKLPDDETVCKLANGMKRFKLPAEFNYINIYKELAKAGVNDANNALAQIYENRMQYDKAAEHWKLNGNQERVQQILGNWGMFLPVQGQPAGQPASFDFIFRNGKKVSFEAQQVKVDQLLADIKEHIKSRPRELNWRLVQLHDISQVIVNDNGTINPRFLGEKVAAWDLNLEPEEGHFEKAVPVKTPLQKAGLYFITAKMDDGNTSHIIVWLDDLAIIKKNVAGNHFYFVADAVTGKPAAGAKVEFFGYQYRWIRDRQHEVNIQEQQALTDASGQVILPGGTLAQNFQWMAVARSEDGKMAFLGFEHLWVGQMHHQDYNNVRAYVITDRPVYRPGQPVKFKFWVRRAKYELKDGSEFAGMNFPVEIVDPKGQKIHQAAMVADEFGGFDGEFTLPKDATLGQYYVHTQRHGGLQFRVEEYKKPEFEVKVDAPTEPVALGEKIEAKISAKYFFGAPVVNAKVKYKITRNTHSANWYPMGCWDWLYGSGYWWFAHNYTWYPGWSNWGMPRPHRAWWGHWQQSPPEIIQESEVQIGADGIVNVEIDTAVAKQLYGNQDQRYDITAEVVDESRRTIVGSGSVIVASQPFKVYAWLDRGYYRAGDVVGSSFSAQTLDGKPVKGKGKLVLYSLTYKEDGTPVEKSVEEWNLDTNEQGAAQQQFKAAQPGQYRLSYKLTDDKKHVIEGGYIFVVRGEKFDGKQFRFNEIELVTDKREYAPGEKVKLMINTERAEGTVLLFVRPADGLYPLPKVIQLAGKSTVEEIDVAIADMPNFFIEACTISNGRIYRDVREITVPPEKRVLNIEVQPSSTEYKPGQKADVKVKVTDMFGKPFNGSLVVSVYDKSIEYISGGANVPEIKAFFWNWRRNHYPQEQTSIGRQGHNRAAGRWMDILGQSHFGGRFAGGEVGMADAVMEGSGGGRGRMLAKGAMAPGAPMAMKAEAQGAAPAEGKAMMVGGLAEADDAGNGGAGSVEAVIRKEFADTAFWAAALKTDADGIATFEMKMPENLTTWRIKTWGMGNGTQVGEAVSDVLTTKKLILRLQAPRFFVEKDEVVLSANIHNYLKDGKQVKAVLELMNTTIQNLELKTQEITVDANGEKRVDWRVKVLREGEAVIRMSALTDEESDAMEMRFPVLVHGILKTESWSGVVRPNAESATITFNVPKERRINESHLEIRYSPSLAAAMVDALPYMADYPYGCTEQTLNRFLPSVITRKVLVDMGLDLKAIQAKRTNLNAQEIGDDKERAKQWKRFERNPVFEAEELDAIINKGITDLTAMQCGDGGWGWFSGHGEQSWPHTTAYVIHGFQTARQNGLAIDPNVFQRGVQWLRNYQNEQTRRMQLPKNAREYKPSADNLDAFIYMVLLDEDVANADMNDFLYRDRINLSVYAKAMYGIALHKQKQAEKLAMILRNIEQFLQNDDENQTAWLKLPDSWWHWYGSTYEAHAYYLKLLSLTDPKAEKTSRLVKYLLNNRKNGTYWNSTRDTALCVEAFADYIRATGEMKPDMTVEILIDGKKQKEVQITAENLFTFDNRLVMFGDAVETGAHKIEVRRKGAGPVYFNAYLTNFTLEDDIKSAGLEVKVDRKYYLLTKVEDKKQAAGARGQVVAQKREKFERKEIKNLDQLKSGDMVEIELTIDSKNDYEYILVEDMKAAGFEPVDLRSGYGGNGMGAYIEFRDTRVCFFVRALRQGKQSVSYRMRAEIPGQFSALPAKIYAMYAPELKGNSDEIKVRIAD